MKLNFLAKKDVPILNLLRQEPNLKDIELLVDQIKSKEPILTYKYKDDVLHILNEEATLYHIVNTTKKMEKLADASRDNHDGVMLDVGGNIGLFSYFYKKKYPKSKVYIFEADDQLVPIINLNLKSFSNFEVLNAAVSDINGTVDFFNNPASSQTNSTEIDAVLPFAKSSNIIKKSVSAITLQKFCQDNDILHIKTLKIDIQGGEYKVLKSSSSILNLTEELLVEVCFLMPNTIPLIKLMDDQFKKHEAVNDIIMGADIKFFN